MMRFMDYKNYDNMYLNSMRIDDELIEHFILSQPWQYRSVLAFMLLNAQSIANKNKAKEKSKIPLFHSLLRAVVQIFRNNKNKKEEICAGK
ncbi:MAG: hypothetical protein ABIL02_00550 [candidate division WOR-3 bacterium]